MLRYFFLNQKVAGIRKEAKAQYADLLEDQRRFATLPPGVVDFEKAAFEQARMAYHEKRKPTIAGELRLWLHWGSLGPWLCERS